MTTIGTIGPKMSIPRGYYIQIDVATGDDGMKRTDSIGMNLCGGPYVIGIGLTKENIDELIRLLKKARKTLR